MAKNSITPHPTIAHLFAILILMLATGGSLCASAYMMPIDQLMQLSNQQLSAKAQVHWDKGELDSALICFNIVANRADRKQSRENQGYVSGSLTAMANIYTSKFYDYERAMQCLLKSEQFAREHHFNVQLVDIYEAMASLEDGKNDIQHDFAFNKDAFELHRKAFNLADKHHNYNTMVVSIINLITVGLGDHKLDLIKDELNTFQVIELYDSILAPLQFAKHQCKAATYVLHKRYDSALNELAQLDDCLDMVGHMIPTARFIAHDNRFFIYRDMDNLVLALSELDSMEQIASKHNIKTGLLEVFLHKRNYYAAHGNSALSKEYDLRYLQLKSQLLEEAKVAKADEEKVLFKLNEANHEIKELSYKQRIQKTELIAVAVVAVLLLALLVLAWVNYRRTKQKNETLYQHNMQLMANENRLRQLHQAEEEATSAPTVKYRRSNMEGDDITQVMEKVDRVMESSTEIFSADFSLDRLAELTGETRLRLSQAINKVPGRTFYSILNGYRVREACRRMDDKAKYSGLTIEAIGQSVGFKNRSSFVAIFKRITGVTPSAYFKQTTEPNSPTSEPQAD